MSDINLLEAPLQTGVRDAIHVAVVSLLSGADLWPGQPVTWHVTGKSVKLCTGSDVKIGIVNPFMKEAVGYNEKVWIMLYPNSVTGMTHNWSHPEFDEVSIDRELAESIIENMAESLGMSSYEDSIAKDRLIEYANEYCRHQSGVWPGDDYVADPRDWENFWKAYSAITGNPRPTENRVPFRCAC